MATKTRKPQRAVKANVRFKSTCTSRRKYPRITPMMLENLETRQLLATINVADFGANPNDGRDDLGAIHAAINAARPGDVIRFAAGTYDIGGKVNIAKGVTLEGVRGQTVLRGFGPTGPQMHITGDNVTVRNLTFDGGGLFIDKPGGSWNDNITIDYNVFNTRTNNSHYHKASLTWTSGLRNSRVTNNFITSSTFAVWGNNGNNLLIANNEINGAGYGMKVTGYHNNNHNVVVRQNYVTNVRAMGFEFQGEFDNLLVEDNYYDKPALSSKFSDNDTTFAFSIIADRSRNTIMRRNTVIAPERPDGVGVRIGFEAGGENVQVVDNYVNGINHVAILNTSRNGRIVDNSFANFLQGANAYGGRSPGAFIANNNLRPDQLTWDVNRGKPGVGKSVPSRKGEVVTPPPVVNPPPVNNTPAAPSNLSAKVLDETRVELTWNDNSGNETGFKLERSTDGGKTWAQFATTGANVRTFTVTGLTTGQEAQFRVRATNASGDSAFSNTATARPSKLILSTDGIQLSSLNWSSAINGWGQAEKDMSNGQQAANDGSTISIAGQRYARGLGVHAHSELTYELDGKYTRFLSDVGIDDYSGTRGTVVFQVFVDGVKRYDSGLVKGGEAARKVDVDLTGAKQMKLVVTNGGDNIDFDHGNWADARLIAATTPPPNSGGNEAPPPPPPPADNGGGMPVNGKPIYLTNVLPTVVKNGWGPIEFNMSNGERAPGDGSTMTIRGKEYAVGFGVHAYSELHFQLDAKYATFATHMGVDDYVGGRGSVVFQVWGDGVKLYDSDVVTGQSPLKTAFVDVTGVKTMVLIVTDADDNKDFDHANWALPKLYTEPVAAPVTTTHYLSDMEWLRATNGWGQIERDMSNGERESNDGSPMTLNGKVYEKGLGVHSYSEIRFALNGKYSSFVSDVGLDDSVGKNGSVIFQVWADGSKLFDSGLMTGGAAAKTVNVNVSGRNELWLIVTDAGDGKDFDHANWAGARLIV